MIHKQDIDTAVENITFADIFKEASRVNKTIEIVLKFVDKATLLLLRDGTIRVMKWYNFKAWYDLALMSYDLIKNIIALWK
jgi:hypothetical protein